MQSRGAWWLHMQGEAQREVGGGGKRGFKMRPFILGPAAAAAGKRLRWVSRRGREVRGRRAQAGALWTRQPPPQLRLPQ